jgi:hypothetical protein
MFDPNESPKPKDIKSEQKQRSNAIKKGKEVKNKEQQK